MSDCQWNKHYVLLLICLLVTVVIGCFRYNTLGVTDYVVQQARCTHEKFTTVCANERSADPCSHKRSTAPSRCKACNLVNLDEQVDTVGNISCVKLRVWPYPKQCVYDTKVDEIVSGSIVKGGVWEPHLVKLIQSVLLANPGMGFIDIGGNIGHHTNIAASIGRQVVTIEPNPENLLRIRKTVSENNLQNNVLLLHNAISDEHTAVTLWVHNKNKGHTFVNQDNLVQGLENRNAAQFKDLPKSVNTIVMDDLIDVVPFREALIKIDIQGYEHKAFGKCRKFLSEINVPVIIVEWEFYSHSFPASEGEEFLDWMTSLGYAVFNLNWSPLTSNHTKWPVDVLFVKNVKY